LLRQGSRKTTIADVLRTSLNGHPLTVKQLHERAQVARPTISRKQVSVGIAHLKGLGQAAIAGMKNKRNTLWIRATP
jgi:hypothetical protein